MSDLFESADPASPPLGKVRASAASAASVVTPPAPRPRQKTTAAAPTVTPPAADEDPAARLAAKLRQLEAAEAACAGEYGTLGVDRVHAAEPRVIRRPPPGNPSFTRLVSASPSAVSRRGSSRWTEGQSSPRGRGALAHVAFADCASMSTVSGCAPPSTRRAIR